MALSKEEKKELKSKAHHIEPTVIYGKNGLTDAFIEQVNLSLKSHELIKIKFIKSKEEKKAIFSSIAEKTASEIVSSIGNILILYKEDLESKKKGQ